MKILKLSIEAILFLAIVYVITAYTSLESDPLKWSDTTRSIVSGLTAAFLIYATNTFYDRSAKGGKNE